MYAVVKTSGRQYRVSPGDSFSVEKLDGEPGSTIQIKEVLMVGGEKLTLGNPFVSGATVTVVVEQQYRGPKILVFKKKRRHKYRNMRGHRSELTRLFVSEIATSGGSLKAETKPHIIDDVVQAQKRDARLAKNKEARHQKAKSAKSGEGEAQPVKAKAASKSPKKTGSKTKAGTKKSTTKKKSSK